MTVPKKAVSCDKAPEAIGPYSQAVKAGHLLFCSGQIPTNPSSGKLVQGNIKVQTKQVLENLKAVLEAAGSNLDQVVKTTVYLADMSDFLAFNNVYAEFFNKPYPARATVEVSRLPKNVKIEIEAIALTLET